MNVSSITYHYFLQTSTSVQRILSLQEGFCSFSKFLDKVSSLVLVDPLSDPLGLCLACCSQRFWVGFVWKTEIQMVGRVLDEDGDSLLTHLLEDTSGVPWIQGAIAENDIGCLHEVFLGVVAAEVRERPVVLW